MPDVIGVEKSYVAAASGGQSGVSRGRDTLIGLADRPDARPVSRYNLRRRIGRAIVDDYDFEGRNSLSKSAVDCLRQILRVIVRRNDHGDGVHTSWPLTASSGLIRVARCAG